jgi:general secretion pathway protein B
MSYILDAIRKSDLQRQRGAAPTLLTSHAAAVAPRRPATTFYLALALALLAAGIAIGWLRPWQANPGARSQNASPAGAPGAAVPIAPFASAPEPVKKFEHETVAAKAAPAPLPSPPSAPAASATAAPAPGMPAPQAAATGSATEKDNAVGEAKALNFADLPQAIQQEIPRLSISVHAYSSQPKNRLVTIDDRLLREGDSAGPGLKIEQITPDGLIFSYKGYRFRRSVQEIVNNR